MAFNIWDWKKKPEITGKLTAKLSNIPPYGKRLYGVELDSGEVWYFWGTYVLVGILAPLPFMTKIRLRCLGKGRAAPEDKYEKILFEHTILALPTEKKKSKKKQPNEIIGPPTIKRNIGTEI